MARPLFWAAPADAEARGADAQWLLGDAVLVSPVVTEGADAVRRFRLRKLPFWSRNLAWKLCRKRPVRGANAQWLLGHAVLVSPIVHGGADAVRFQA